MRVYTKKCAIRNRMKFLDESESMYKKYLPSSSEQEITNQK
jgi:hypothetical protein